jgi:hypothetical protein
MNQTEKNRIVDRIVGIAEKSAQNGQFNQNLVEELSINLVDEFFGKTEVEEEVLYVLSEDAINGIDINDVIRDDQIFEWEIVDREEYIDKLFGWIAEARTHSDKILMKDDLQMLSELSDEYVFSSMSTNDFIYLGHSDFNETCENLLKLNEGFN